MNSDTERTSEGERGDREVGGEHGDGRGGVRGGELFEFAVSQHVDGVLGEPDRRALGSRLDAPAARAIAMEHGRLNTLLRGFDPVPLIDFDAVAADFSAALAAEPAYAAAPLRLPTAWLRPAAVAAGVAVAALLAWQVLPFARHGGTGGVTRGEAIVHGPAETTPAATAVADVRVGPSEAMVQRGLAMGYGHEQDKSQKPRVVITSADNAANDAKPY